MGGLGVGYRCSRRYDLHLPRNSTNNERKTMNKTKTIKLPNKKGKHYYFVTVVDGHIVKVTERRTMGRDAAGRYVSDSGAMRQKRPTRGCLILAAFINF